MRQNVNGLLVVEDDADALLLLRRALAKVRLGPPIRIAVDGQQAVDYLSGEGPFADRERHPLPCLVLLNLKLPKRSGLEVLEWMRRQVHLRRIPVIIISTSGEEEDRVRALQLGAREYHIKPIDIRGLHQLARRVKTYLHLFGARLCELIEQDREDVPSR